MKLREFTLRLGYKVDGKEHMLVLDGPSADNYGDEMVLVTLGGDEGRLLVKLTVAKPVELTLAELVYDRYFESNDAFFANGFQSWTVSREYRRGEQQNGLNPICNAIPIAKKFAGASGDYHFAQYGRDLYHSFTYTYIRNGEKVDLLGSLNERTGYTVFYADMREKILAVVKDVEGLRFDGEYELFDIVERTGSYDEVFDAYFEAYPLKHTGRVDRMAGYTSWYNYYQSIDEKTILRDLEGLRRAEDMADIFQIDDGFETMVGDWTIDSQKFPNGLMPIVDKIHAQGLKAGLWLAPFAAQFKAEIVKNHPEWLIKDKKGKPIVSGIAWMGFYALDFELDEVKAYIRDLFKRVFDEWGFDMVKLDFLYSAAIYPRNGKTRGQLMCEAMDFLRECCGDKLILGCGIPLGPAFGVVDACRIGCDAEISFKDKYYVKLTNQEIVSTRNSMNNAVFRRHLDGRIFANDPDVFFLREGGFKAAKYNLTQKKLLAKVNNMFGSILFVSDDIGEYSDDMLALLKQAYTPFEGRVTCAEYIGADTIAVNYELNGEKHRFCFNTRSGDFEDSAK